MSAARSGKVRDERGIASVITMVILLPLMFLFVWLALQATVAARTNQVAAHAAQEGARAMRERNGSVAEGVAKAWQVLNALSPGVLQGARVRASRNGDVARVEVTGRAISVVPGFNPRVDQVSEGKVERFRRIPSGFGNSEAPSDGNSSEGAP